MAIKVGRGKTNETRTQRIRRERHADRIAQMSHRFYGRQWANQAVHAQNDRQRYDPNDVNNNILNQDDSFIPTIILEDIPEDPEWITLPDESDDDFDEAVYTHRRKWQQMARDCDWEKLLGRLHPHYVHLKIRTNNWSNVNTYADHTNCKCPPHLQTRRPVDLVDING
ncbi:hypothetical protein PSTG_19188 [Puccinia striiformis f. sp. tritici PST-78]|uniref:CxC1-like cysteine cluster associated with KDZ transposases domain-containing protein n=1 Tax=Puccinia striiformis f. sp. tritici PST-78 TaxID=1165861 RepID=A0A0L0UJ47_9BASI|nr:hypothetical protein PSTG_19601 [Puccinia striiformis f. sp. tritici PST-78]KNE87250.1 hypothetical protein PSTG_19369 [Puccinia striiformis f. sp. tritici PST-78]KNE87324.1 hypothetical protein PSTG_19294 [Puccinia striiformis f. sp. tritici PST-78]KNE87427.1 hypothetical protein PSTG_19188 [Puccinia striiformis f. sp. tritici PST-78]